MLTNNVKGTHDIIGEEANGFAYIENVLKQICEDRFIIFRIINRII